MRELSKKQNEERSRLVKRLSDAAGLLDGAAADFNEVANDIEAFASGIAESIREFVSDKSDRWQESERGQAFAAWLEEWEGFAEGVEGIEVDIPSYGDDLEQLNSGPEVD